MQRLLGCFDFNRFSFSSFNVFFLDFAKKNATNIKAEPMNKCENTKSSSLWNQNDDDFFCQCGRLQPCTIQSPIATHANSKNVSKLNDS